MCSEASSCGGTSLFSQYQTLGFYDELIDEFGRPRLGSEQLVRFIEEMPTSEIIRRHGAIERSLYEMGITFTVYGDAAGTEKIMPFDIIPRIISSMLWRHIDAGLRQRIKALNCFLSDVYGAQEILRDNVVPRELVESASTFLPQCVGLTPPHGIWCHISGSDLIRDDTGAVFVLEDNLRCPSGVSYVLQNRQVMKKNFPQISLCELLNSL